MTKRTPIAEQLSLGGLDETMRFGEANAATLGDRTRKRGRILNTHDILSTLPEEDEIAFLHAGMCQTFLPHVAPKDPRAHWERKAGRFTLVIQPGMANKARHGEDAEIRYQGVPFGTRARLILIYFQTEGVRQGREIGLGSSFSAWMRSLGIEPTGGVKGSIRHVRDQVMRIARCLYTLHFDGFDTAGRPFRSLQDIRIVENFDLTMHEGGSFWPQSIELGSAFHEHLKEHAVPLDSRAISRLRESAMALDLYVMLAYRLPKLKISQPLTWKALAQQLGSDSTEMKTLARRIRVAEPEVRDAYPHAKWEITRSGLLLHPSQPSVERAAQIAGHRFTAVPSGKKG